MTQNDSDQSTVTPSPSQLPLSYPNPVELARAPQQENNPVSSPGFIRKLWRGNYRLGPTFWLFPILTNVTTNLITFGLLILGYAVFNKNTPISIGLLISLISITLSAAAATLTLVSVWRSAKRIRQETKRWFWGIVARILVLIGTVSTAFQLGNLIIFDTFPTLSMVFLDKDPMGTATLKVSKDGSTLTIQGILGSSVTDDVYDTLAANPNIKTVIIDSLGGRIYTGQALGTLFREQGLTTQVDGMCYSACTMAFIGGVHRVLGPIAEVGFHSSSVNGSIGIQTNITNWVIALRAKELGVDAKWSSEAFERNSLELWFPSHEQMLRHNFATELLYAGRGRARSTPYKTLPLKSSAD